MANLRQDFGSATEWLFIGCGSSYYIGLAAAATCSAITGKRARAAPASELLLFPDIVLAGSQEIAAVVISRSGRTSETLKAAQFLEREKDVRTLAITSTVGQPLEQIATSTLPLLPSDEEAPATTTASRSGFALFLLEPHRVRGILLAQPDQVFEFAHELVDIIEGAVDRGKAYVLSLIHI